MAKDISYRMKENWEVTVTAKKYRNDKEVVEIFKFEFQVSATYNFLDIDGLAKTIVKERLGNYWKVTEVNLEMVGSGV